MNPSKSGSGFSDKFRPIEPLNERHRVWLFESGMDSLNRFLRDDALKHYARYKTRVFILATKNYEVVAFYTLEPGIEGTDDEPFPVLKVGSYAVDRKYRERGLTEAMLEEASRRIASLSERRMKRITRR
jgi:ribosomal protein S18 acetylase RimI-like enzyme